MVSLRDVFVYPGDGCSHKPVFGIIVPQLLTEGRYLASERTIYRILRERYLLHHRSELRVRHRHSKPPERRATGSDQVYTWDITYMGRTIRGLYYYAHVVTDIFDKSIVGWAVHAEESETLFERILKGRRIRLKALHAERPSDESGFADGTPGRAESGGIAQQAMNQ